MKTDSNPADSTDLIKLPSIRVNLPWQVWLTVICIVGVLAVTWNVYNKVGWHIDEKWSFAEANGPHTNAQGWAAPGDFFVWNDAAVMRDWLSVQPDERFNYGQAFNNVYVEGGTNPPLYTFWLHTVSSFFPNEAGKKIGLITNLPFYILTIVFLFLTSDALFKSKKAGLIIAAYWAFSLGGVAAGMYFRFYCMLTGTTMMSVYALTRLWLAEKRKIYDYIFLFAAVLLACLTHYYFWIFILIAGVIFAIFDCAAKKGLSKKTIWVLTTLFADVLALAVLLPNVILSVLGVNGKSMGFGNETGKLLSVFSDFTLLTESLSELFTITARDVIASQGFRFSAGKIAITIIIAVISVIVFAVDLSGNKSKSSARVVNKQSLKWIAALFVIVMLTGITVGVADMNWGYEQTERYFWNLMPIIVLLLGCFFIKLLNIISSGKKRRTVRFVFIALLCLLSIKSSFGLESWLVMRNIPKSSYEYGKDAYLFIAPMSPTNSCSIAVPVPLFKEYHWIEPNRLDTVDWIVYKIENHIPIGEKVMIAQVHGYSPDILNDVETEERLRERGYVLKAEPQFASPSYSPYYMAEIIKINDYEALNPLYSPDEDKELPNEGTTFNYPYTTGMAANWNHLPPDGKMEFDGSYVTSNDTRIALFGPYAECKDGTYNFTLHYEVVNNPDNLEIVGTFDVATDNGTICPASSEILADETSVTLYNVSINSWQTRFEHRVWTNGASLRIKSFEIEKIGG